MAAFSLPTGDFELLFDDGNGKQWRSVMFTDSISLADIAQCVEEWSINHKVIGARYNGKKVPIPTKYHWDLRLKGEVLEGGFKTRAEAVEAMKKRREMQRTDKSIKAGFPAFIKD